jgi:hypothetical protein
LSSNYLEVGVKQALPSLREIHALNEGRKSKSSLKLLGSNGNTNSPRSLFGKQSRASSPRGNENFALKSRSKFCREEVKDKDSNDEFSDRDSQSNQKNTSSSKDFCVKINEDFDLHKMYE